MHTIKQETLSFMQCNLSFIGQSSHKLPSHWKQTLLDLLVENNLIATAYIYEGVYIVRYGMYSWVMENCVHPHEVGLKGYMDHDSIHIL